MCSPNSNRLSCADFFGRQFALRGDTRELKFSGLGADVRIEPAAARGEQIARRARTELRATLVDRLCKIAARRPLVAGTAGDRCKVGGGRPRPKVLRAVELLREQFGAEDFSVAHHERAVCFFCKQHFRDAGDGERINHAGEQREDEQDAECVECGFHKVGQATRLPSIFGRLARCSGESPEQTDAGGVACATLSHSRSISKRDGVTDDVFIFNYARRSATSAMMMSALKMTALRIALSEEWRCMMFSAASGPSFDPLTA